tara:strand:- start:1323 stop:1826 length:504 start_codon:yes stop_codon:yes gene_type:complete
MLANVKDELNRFAKYVVSQSRANLTRGKKNSSKDLYNSLDSEVKVSKNSFELSFLMEEYGVFQDKGVSGVKKKYSTPYSYTTKMPPPSKMDKWIVKKGIAPRDKNGKFISRKSLQFMIARSIFNNGIKPSLFFTKPFEKAFKNLNKDLVEAYKLDVEQLIKNTINNK